MTDSIVLPLAGGQGLRLTVADDGGVYGWLDLLMPDGEYIVEVSTSDGLVAGLRLDGPVLPGELVARSTTEDVPSGSLLCLADSRHRQPTLGPYLAREAVAAELGGSHAKVVTPSLLSTPVLLFGPTAAGYQDLWNVAWRKGGNAHSTVTLSPMEY